VPELDRRLSLLSGRVEPSGRRKPVIMASGIVQLGD
jgi:hypothetical protein